MDLRSQGKKKLWFLFIIPKMIFRTFLHISLTGVAFRSDNFGVFHTFSDNFFLLFMVSAVPRKAGGICFASFAKLWFASVLHSLE